MINQDTPQVIFIVGPTAVGKTDLALALAERLQTVIISADSRQCYREMSIGTAKPTTKELERVPHYFINSHTVDQDFSAGDFEKEALSLLDRLFLKHHTVIVVGGSGLFVDALERGFDDLPKPAPGVREKWNQLFEDRGLEFIQNSLSNVDPIYYQQIDQQNPQRIIRALEVFESTGRPFSFYRQKKVQARAFKSFKFALNMDRNALYQRINFRVDKMNEAGLLEEVKTLIPHKSRPALLTVGYREVFEFLDHPDKSWEETLNKIKQNTRNYAKRQITWFKKDPNTVWLNAENSLEDLMKQIQNTI